MDALCLVNFGLQFIILSKCSAAFVMSMSDSKDFMLLSIICDTIVHITLSHICTHIARVY